MKLEKDGLDIETGSGHGKKPNQKLKPYVVMQYLLQNTDENHTVDAFAIMDYLAACGITAERRSIYKDIDEINKVMWLVENKHDETDGIQIEDAEQALKDYEDEKLVVYDKSKKGFYVRQRHYDPNDIRLLAECVYSAKFLSQKEADRLADAVCGFVSKHQAEKFRHDAFLTDRVKTQNKSVLQSITLINDAMSRKLDGEKHEPEKITFQYLKYSINDVGQQVERRKGQKYTVSPYKLLINDGNYYLLAFDDHAQDMRTYRVDRMKNVSFTGIPREGEDCFKAIDLKGYTKRVFSMFGGQDEKVVIHFINPLLDAVVDRFGNDKSVAWYEQIDDRHFTVTTHVEISDQFFGWILGFGKKAKLLYPEDAVNSLVEYIRKIEGMYR